MKRFLLAALMVLAPLAAQAEERVLMDLPKGWHPGGTQRSDKGETTMIYPPGQSPENWSEMLVLQRLRDDQAKPHQFMQQLIEASRQGCEAVGPSPITENAVNGYPKAAVTISCTKGRRTGKGGLVMALAMRGREALWVVQRLWQGQPFARNEPVPVPQSVLGDWGAFARSVGLCEDGDPKHPCPK